MIEDDKVVFNISVNEYMLRITKYISERLSPHEYTDSVTIRTRKSNNREVVSQISLHIRNKKFSEYEYSSYRVKLSETIYPLTQNSIYTKKYSYELNNEDDLKDVVRFDYYPYEDFPHFHINADPDVWGNHLTYPDKTNINLEKMNCFKALNIFQRFVANPDVPILDDKNNQRYIEIVNGGER